MKTDVHIRLIVSRGIKSTPYQDPAFTISKPTIIVIPEYKQPQKEIYKKGLVLKTVKTIRGPHNVQDPRINSLSKLNCIIACIEAKKKKADEALMFDINGNIATNNSTHFFFVKNNCVYTSTGQYCVKGITRQKVIDLCKKNKIKVYEKNFKLKDVLSADEAFVTGTFANIIPVKKINNKSYNLKNNLTTKKIRELYLKLMDRIMLIFMWSGPRNLSTALMRSFENRDDTIVHDEPFYGYYLFKTQLNHPMKDEIIK